MSKESYSFKYCSSDTIRESPLPFSIQDYPADRIIDTTGETVLKLSRKLFSLLENKDYDLDSILVKCQQKFSEDVIDKIEKLKENIGLKSESEIFPDYLWLQMPEGRAHRAVAGALDTCICNALRARFQGQYWLGRDLKVVFNQRGNYWEPDCSAFHLTRDTQRWLHPPTQLIPNLVVEVASSQTTRRLLEKTGNWFTVDNALGHQVNVALAVDLEYRDRAQPDNKAKSISSGRLHSVTFALFIGAESIQGLVDGVLTTTFMPEVQTIKATINDNLEVEFAYHPPNDPANEPEPEPEPLSGNTSPHYFQDRDNNLRFPFHMIDGVEDEHHLENILLTAENIIYIVQQAYFEHEVEIRENVL